MEHVIVTVELSIEQAWALAQLVKRISWNTCRRMAEAGIDDQHRFSSQVRIRGVILGVVSREGK